MVGQLDVLRAQLMFPAVRFLGFVFPVAWLLGCAGDHEEKTPMTAADSQAAHVAEVAAAGGVVDSIIPVAEALSRFRATVAEHPDTLRGASRSLDSLAHRWAAAVAQRDSAALNAMVLDRAEFAWLYYADSPMSKPPYEMPPGLLWSQILANSDEGAKRLLSRFGGHRVVVRELSCPPAKREGENVIHERCTVRASVDGGTLGPARLFGTVIERAGRFKFLGYSNSL